MIYWRAAPEYYRQWASREALLADPILAFQVEGFDFANSLEARYVAGEFRSGSLTFDPSDPLDPWVGAYDDMKPAFVRELPAVMYQAVKPT